MSTQPNPYYDARLPMSLYLRSRVEQTEQSEEFLAWRETSQKRRLSAQKAVQTVRDKEEQERQRRMQRDYCRKEIEKLLERGLDSPTDISMRKGFYHPEVKLSFVFLNVREAYKDWSEFPTLDHANKLMKAYNKFNRLEKKLNKESKESEGKEENVSM